MGVKRTLLSHYKIDINSASLDGYSIGIVKYTRVHMTKAFTDISFETESKSPINIRLKNNAGFLLGRLCLYSHDNNEIWPMDEPDYVFVEYESIPTNDTQVTLAECTICPICDHELKQKI